MRTRLVFAAAAALALAGRISAAAAVARTQKANSPYVYPNIADTSHATHSLVAFFHKVFTAKTLHKLDTFVDFFATTDYDIYFDGTLGGGVSKSELAITLRSLLNQSIPGSKTYPLQIIGDTNSAVVLFVDSPGFTSPSQIHSISAVDFNKDGEVIRWIDYWDGRLNPLIVARTPQASFPKTLGENNITTTPNPSIKSAATRLYTALSTGNSTAAAALFTLDAVFEDRTTRTRIEGKPNIEQYFERTLQQAPWGVSSTLRHIVGSGQGGAYEWVGVSLPETPYGISAIELDLQGCITGVYSVWDASQTDNSTLAKLVKSAVAF